MFVKKKFVFILKVAKKVERENLSNEKVLMSIRKFFELIKLKGSKKSKKLFNYYYFNVKFSLN